MCRYDLKERVLAVVVAEVNERLVEMAVGAEYLQLLKAHRLEGAGLELLAQVLEPFDQLPL